MALQLEPKGLLFAEIKFLNPMITRKPKLRRQRKIFRQQGKMPRPDQMNINVATWGRLLKRNLNFQKSVGGAAAGAAGGGSADTNNHAKDAAAASTNMHPEGSSASRQDNTSATGECGRNRVFIRENFCTLVIIRVEMLWSSNALHFSFASSLVSLTT